VLRDGHELRVVLGNLTAREITRIGGEAGVDLALVVEPLVFTMLAAFEGVIPWSGAPFSWHQLPDEERVVPPGLATGETAQLTVVLVDGNDGVVRAVRPLTLTPEFSAALHAAIRDQASRIYERGEYERHAATLHEQWRTGVLADRACAWWSSGRAGTGGRVLPGNSWCALTAVTLVTVLTAMTVVPSLQPQVMPPHHGGERGSTYYRVIPGGR